MVYAFHWFWNRDASDAHFPLVNLYLKFDQLLNYLLLQSLMYFLNLVIKKNSHRRTLKLFSKADVYEVWKMSPKCLLLEAEIYKNNSCFDFFAVFKEKLQNLFQF